MTRKPARAGRCGFTLPIMPSATLVQIPGANRALYARLRAEAARRGVHPYQLFDSMLSDWLEREGSAETPPPAQPTTREDSAAA